MLFHFIHFQLTQQDAAWDRSIPNAKCISVKVLAYAVAGMGVGFDLIILALPVPELLKLKMSGKKKRHVLFMFSLGSMYAQLGPIHLQIGIANP